MSDDNNNLDNGPNVDALFEEDPGSLAGLEDDDDLEDLDLKNLDTKIWLVKVRSKGGSIHMIILQSHLRQSLGYRSPSSFQKNGRKSMKKTPTLEAYGYTVSKYSSLFLVEAYNLITNLQSSSLLR